MAPEERYGGGYNEDTARWNLTKEFVFLRASTPAVNFVMDSMTRYVWI